MSGASKKLMGTTAAADGFTAIEDVFSTHLYTGNGSTQTINNGIDLAGEGGLVWGQVRSTSYDGGIFVDTERGNNKYLLTALTTAEQTSPAGFDVTSFNSDGFSVGQLFSGGFNASGQTFASWTFRKAPRFFDVVTWTGDGTGARSIPHNLGVVPACIVFKRLDASEDWWTYHRGITSPNGNWWLNFVTLNSTGGSASSLSVDEPTDANLNLGSNNFFNGSGKQYVAYLFAHDPLGPSGDGSDGLIDCGSFTTNSSGSAGLVNLGWEPQWFLMKRVDSSQDWFIVDNMRGLPVGDSGAGLSPNTSGAEGNVGGFSVRPTGIEVSSFSANATYIYIAIRRGPMRVPESGTEVFTPISREGNSTSNTVIPTGFTTDLFIVKNKDSGWQYSWADRLRGAVFLNSASTAGEQSFSIAFDEQDGIRFPSANNSNNTTGQFFANWGFRRAPNFFDVVAYTGDGVAGRTVPHNLGAAPELMIIKNRQQTYNWVVYNKDVGATGGLLLQSNSGIISALGYFNNTDPNASVITLGGDPGSGFVATNESGGNYIAYLFATLPGVSKVGSYTGNGTSQTINCGFTSGARFILIKRTDNTGDWYVWDTARGIVTANDPFLRFNSDAAETTNDDSIDPDGSGFIVNQTASTSVNVSSASYIFLAIA
jgi:hypothetical protein